MAEETRGPYLALEFLDYCRNNPSQRFWQALRNWSGQSFIGASSDKKDWTDTFYWKGKEK